MSGGNIFLIVIIIYLISYNSGESFLNYRTCPNKPLSKRLLTIFNKYGLINNQSKWDVYIPCDYTNIEAELKTILPGPSRQKIFGISGGDYIVSKYYLWKTLLKRYSSNYTSFFPKTYSCSRGGIRELLNNHKDGQKYIAKKDTQRQTGLHIIHSITDIYTVLNDTKNVVIQNLLNNPFLIKGRKINMRIYLLIVCNSGKIEAYIHQNGFMYYTPKMFNYKSTDKDAHITTGYIDREIYNTHPLTIDEFYTYLDKNNYNCNKLKSSIVKTFRQVLAAIHVPICKKPNIYNRVTFQLFGCDIAPDTNLNVKLIEINKGPDLSAKSSKDDKVKNEVVLDTFNKVGIIPGRDKMNRFIKIM